MKKPTRNLLRILLRIFGAILALPVVLYLILLLVNMRDADLLPEVERLMNTPPPQIAAEENGYFAWIGVMGPVDQPAHDWGQRWFKAVTERESKLRGVGEFGDLPILSEVRKEAIAEGESPCKELGACLEKVAATPEKAREMLKRHRTTVERVDQTMTCPAYQEAWRPYQSVVAPFPPFLLQWRDLASARFALTVAEGHHDEALAQMDREIHFYLRQLKSATNLADKIIGLRHLRANYDLLGQYLHRYPEASRQRLAQIDSMLAPPTAAAISMQATIRGEQRLITRPILTLKDGDSCHTGSWLSDLLALPLLLPRASANEMTAFFAPWVLVDGLTGQKYRQEFARIKVAENKRQNAVFVWRNPMGHILLLVAPVPYEKYFQQRDDVIAMRSLVAFQADLLRQRVVGDAAIAAMVEATPDLVHPYFGTHATWDAKQRRLSFPVTGGELPAGDAKPVFVQL